MIGSYANHSCWQQNQLCFKLGYIIEHLREFRVTSTYEVCRFKISAVVSNTESSRLTDFDAKNRLIRVISDNFDTHVHTENRVKQINGLVTIITQSYSTPPASLLSPHDWPLVPYLAQEKTKDVSFKEVQIQFFNGPKKLPLPKNLFNNSCAVSKIFVQTSSSILSF